MKSGSGELVSKMRGHRWLASGLIIIAAFGAIAKAGAGAAAAEKAGTSEAVAQPLIMSGKSSASEPASEKISPVISEIIKLLDAKADPSVVKAYIQNASMAYNPTAGE